MDSMEIKYYEFNTSFGSMHIIFSDKGILSLHLPNEREEEIINWAGKKYGKIQKVDKDKYIYHHEILEYFKGNREKFSINLDIRGTDFQKKVWNELLNIPYGKVRTYKEIAQAVGCPRGFRAVGGTLNKNPIPILIPCHRVIGSDGNLTGFRGGLNLKEKLLILEGYL